MRRTVPDYVPHVKEVYIITYYRKGQLMLCVDSDTGLPVILRTRKKAELFLEKQLQELTPKKKGEKK